MMITDSFVYKSEGCLYSMDWSDMSSLVYCQLKAYPCTLDLHVCELKRTPIDQFWVNIPSTKYKSNTFCVICGQCTRWYCNEWDRTVHLQEFWFSAVNKGHSPWCSPVGMTLHVNGPGIQCTVYFPDSQSSDIESHDHPHVVLGGVWINIVDHCPDTVRHQLIRHFKSIFVEHLADTISMRHCSDKGPTERWWKTYRCCTYLLTLKTIFLDKFEQLDWFISNEPVGTTFLHSDLHLIFQQRHHIVYSHPFSRRCSEMANSNDEPAEIESPLPIFKRPKDDKEDEQPPATGTDPDVV